MKKSTGYILGREFVKLPALKGSKVRSAQESLDRRIEKVNILEVPDIEKYVDKNEIIISTLYPFKDNLDEFRKTFRKLADQNIAGLAIKPRRFIENIPQEIIDIADEYGMLLVELPDHTIFADVVYEAVERISNESVTMFVEIQNRTELLLLQMNRSKSIEETLFCMEQEIKTPLFVIDSVNKSFCTKSAKEILGELDYELCNKIREKVKDGEMSQLFLQNRKIKMYTMEIIDRNASSMLLNMITDQPMKEVEAGILENVAQMLFIQVRNDRIVKEQARKYKSNFLIDCLKGILNYEEDILHYAAGAEIQMDGTTKYFVGILSREDWNAWKEHQLAFWMRQWEKKFLVVAFEDNIVFLFDEMQEANLEYLFQSEFLRQQLPAERLQIYVSDGNEITGLATGYQQALKIKQIAVLCKLEKQIVRYQDLGSYTILSLIPVQDKEVVRLLKRFIDPIWQYDQAHNTKLLETLGMYFEAEQNLRETAVRMYTHYNTISYRMDKIKELLHLERWDADILLQLQIALKLEKMSDRKEVRSNEKEYE